MKTQNLKHPSGARDPFIFFQTSSQLDTETGRNEFLSGINWLPTRRKVCRHGSEANSNPGRVRSAIEFRVSSVSCIARLLTRFRTFRFSQGVSCHAPLWREMSLQGRPLGIKESWADVKREVQTFLPSIRGLLMH